ncbi:unnamed protein product [Penicillium nalgiovense]|nr:unnamed protein product [Penicillium nalgiovense]CAG8089117.1 unnamed protein product [Penicillium nalgiovense]CAG8098986.1 unnamed protein product [Penicillium nalgiovense]
MSTSLALCYVLHLSGMEHNHRAVPLQLFNINFLVAVLDGSISLFSLISYLQKDNYYLSEAQESPSPLPPS